MGARLTPGQWATLGGFLCRWFSLGELKRLAFDLGAGFDVFSAVTRQSCALALIRSLERVGQLGCLIDEVRRQVPGVALPALSQASPCVRRQHVAVLLPVEWASVSVSSLQRDLADGFRVPMEQVIWMAAAGDQVHLLLSLPGDAPALPAADALGRGRYTGSTVRGWERLSRSECRRWRVVARRWPPNVQGDRLHPAVSWAAVRTSVRSRQAWLVVVAVILVAVAGAWAHGRLVPVMLPLWHHWWLVGSQVAHNAVLWLQFLGSIALSALALSWMTAFWFSLGALLLYGMSHWPRLDPSIREWPRRHDRLIGTALNLLSSICSLALLPHVIRRPPDYWDLGIQSLVAVLIELVVLGVLPR